MESDTLYQQGISKKQFFKDLDMAKIVVDAGLDAQFLLINNSSFSETRTVGGTTLQDIKDVCNGVSIYGAFRYAIPHTDPRTGEVTASMVRIRDATKADRKRLRGTYRFFPPQTYIAEMADAKGGGVILYPFKQNADGSIVPLFESNIYRQQRVGGEKLKEYKKLFSETVFQEVERIIELFPDLMDSLLASVEYKGVEMLIPIEKSTAKKTFRTRDKEDGRRRHLIHNVESFDRKDLKNANKVKSHLRGKSCFTIDSIDVTLIATTEWSSKYKR